MNNERDQDDFVSLEEWDHPEDEETEEPEEESELLFDDMEPEYRELNFDPHLIEVLEQDDIPGIQERNEEREDDDG